MRKGMYKDDLKKKLYFKYYNATNSCSKLLKFLIFLNFVIVIIHLFIIEAL